jgi:hypothetical protein
MSSHEERILILCKTYPSPSARYAETSCVAGMRENGELIRLYPVPFRLVNDDQQFKKWQWVNVRVEKSKKDHRPESYKIFVDTIRCDTSPLSTSDQWRARRLHLDKLEIFQDHAALEIARVERGITLGIVRPARILGLDIRPTAQPDWTDQERVNLLQMQKQVDLFDDSDDVSLRQLRKIPYDFHYRYECEMLDGTTAEYRHKVVDWEIGALYWNVSREHGKYWEAPLRKKIENELPGKDLMFLMGTIHRFPDQWLIVSLIYPPKQRPEAERQGVLL